MSMEPYAVINTTERCGSRRRISRNRSSPLRSGRLTSSNSRSNGFSSSRVSPASAVSALEVEYPSVVSSSSNPSRISNSSSTTRMAPLDMNRFPCGREFEPEGRAFVRGGAHVDFPGMLLDDAVAHRKPQARTAAGDLRGEKGIKDAVQIFMGNSGACIGDFDFNRAVVRRRADFHHASRGHGIARTHEEIQQDPLQQELHPVLGSNNKLQQVFPHLFMNARDA